MQVCCSGQSVKMVCHAELKQKFEKYWHAESNATYNRRDSEKQRME
jgi:hypothetical protein